MSTKNNPGAFRCYQAALPDEPIFTILGRDPAGPATLEFWANERLRLGKTQTADDQDRVHVAEIEAIAMRDWREANLAAGPDDQPSWKAIQMNDDDLGPVRVLPDVQYIVPAEREGDEALRVSVEWLRHLTGQLTRGDISRDFYAELIEAACNSPDRRERVVPVEEAAYDAARRDERTITMANAITNAIYMLGELGAVPGYALSLNAIRETLFNSLSNAPVTAEARKADFAPSGGFVVDSQPDDLAHGPEVPPHRFSTFRKGKHYAYARGLEISPAHLPTALDAMAEDGWGLLAIFGQTDSKHVGFIFERMPTYGFNVTAPRYSRPPGEQSENFRRFVAGEPLEEIRGDDPCGVDGRGRGLEP